MINFIIPPQPLNQPPSSDVEDLRRRIERLRALQCDLDDLERYHDALVAIRDNSTDVSAVALANNVLMGIQIDFGFFYSPAKPNFQ